MEEFEKLEQKINKILPLSKANLVYKNKIILSESRIMKKLLASIKNNIKKPSKDIEVFIVEARFDFDDEEYPLAITINMNNLTTELKLNPVLGYMKNFLYTHKDLLKYGFKKSHLNQMINAVKNRLVSFRKISSPISEVFDKVK